MKHPRNRTNFAQRTLKNTCLALLIGAPAIAGGFDADKVIKVSTLSGWKNTDGTYVTALKVDLAPGWVTYWRIPGDSGIPMQYDWTASKNVGGASIVWPRPEIDEKYGLTSFVYRDSVVLPIIVVPTNKGQAAELAGTIELGVCKDICVPVQFDISQPLKPENTRKTAAINAALKDLPKSARQAGLSATKCGISPTENGISINTTTKMNQDIGKVHAVIEHADQSFWVGPTSTTQKGKNVHAAAEIESETGSPISIQRQDVRITLLGTREVIDIQGCVGES
ncbi:protein-disulfide reductase DsbD family protein [Halocynthiibacter sp. C4]|uniref:protein-disulfide reductase DsbD domain-containing protein n=1 Tax=Halocynthiibacter sp. C4 TaxID=2992758 RepID=UPI00237C21EF|nr:protein-disulfide reductase DsbD domain-containing protein [Halocynthiibacter sp. C4]MDE0590828.1 protein-disulfide reductase DsbD family protein [Halocynthiibacter sp. C4]